MQRCSALNFEIGIESNQLVVLSVIYINQFLEIKPNGSSKRRGRKIKGENKGRGRGAEGIERSLKEYKEKKTSRFFFFVFVIPFGAIRL